MIHAILLYKQTSKVVLTCYNVLKNAQTRLKIGKKNLNLKRVSRRA